MTNHFRNKIKKSLGDDNLQAALDANADKRVAVRQAAFATLPEPALARARARAVRAEVISNLDNYLEQFTSHLQGNGVQVHRAEDAAQAVQIVLDIAKKSGARLVAKSKTMVSEEIELNPALEKHGLRVVETDLGEYIVQIRHEPPSHIITPAVHLRRADVGHTFHEVLGIPFTDDIATMTTAARHTLRQVFLTADLGISGVNFGVAETGTLCMVTNEGNGRMVTTLPRVHIALMGLERIVPTLDDLALMLSLLPRSATGQKLSVYTSLIHAPRRESDSDGPQERHVILVDNGRSRVRQTPLSEILYCIRCGACLNACPVFREIGGHAYVGKSGQHSAYPGPMGSVVSPALFSQAEFGQLARASSLCGACKEACPVDIDLPGLLLRVRAGKVEANPQPAQNSEEKTVRHVDRPNTPGMLAMGLKAFTWAAISPWRFTLAQRLAALFGRIGSRVIPSREPDQEAWLRLPAFTGWGFGKDFPAPAAKSFHQRWEGLQSQAASTLPDLPVSSQSIVSGNITQSLAPDIFACFEQELKALGAHFTRCQENETAAIVRRLLEEQATSRLLAWESAHLPDRLLNDLVSSGVEIIHPSAETIMTSSQVRIGLTGVTAAVADTGTLLLTSGPGQPLSASLLPEVHIAVMRETDLYPHLPEVLARPEVCRASAAVLISGPSRTADIEMTLTIGVHGPGELYVICISAGTSSAG